MKKSKKSMVKAKELIDTPQFRDLFETPKYAIDILLPFIPDDYNYVWECAVGSGRISKHLCNAGYVVYGTDIREKETKNHDNEIFFKYNFLADNDEPFPNVISDWLNENKKVILITNPPFSIKHLFIERALELNIPFAFLINGDYSKQSIDWVTKNGCEKIIPDSRISYITPNILNRIREAELWRYVQDTYGILVDKLDDFKTMYPERWNEFLGIYPDYMKFSSIDECPDELLYKHSSSQFHSLWITKGFNLGRTETFVDLTAGTKKANIR